MLHPVGMSRVGLHVVAGAIFLPVASPSLILFFSLSATTLSSSDEAYNVFLEVCKGQGWKVATIHKGQ